MNSKVYDLLKWIALILLPGVGALYFALGQLWNFPAVEQVVGSITAIDVFLGMLINKTSKNHAVSNVVGDLVVTQDLDGMASGMRLEANRDPLIFEDQKDAVFRVRREFPIN
jgi:hypothetical protein